MKKTVKITVKMNGNLHRRFSGDAGKKNFPETEWIFSDFLCDVKSGRRRGVKPAKHGFFSLF
jgi:hypothetical protein